MSSSKIKASAFQRPPKFNFLASRIPAVGNAKMRRDWPIGITPADAKRQSRATKRDLEKLQDNALRGAK